MNKILLSSIISCTTLGLCTFPLEAAYTIKNGSLLEMSEVATMSVQEHFSAASSAYQSEKWPELIQQANIILKNFPASPFVHESLFFLGAGRFHEGEYEKADEHLSRYLKKQDTCQYFEQAISLRLAIAEGFRQGAKKHLFGVKALPRCIAANEEAVAIYDEIIAALPHHENAARALFGKGKVLEKDQEYTQAIESFQNLIRRFPKNALAVDGFIEIGRSYFNQAKAEFPNPDFLSLAEINFAKFQDAFPGEARLAEAKAVLAEMQELYATKLYETAQFFERTKKPQAAQLYYKKLTFKYPTTHVAQLAREKLDNQQATSQPVHDTAP